MTARPIANWLDVVLFLILLLSTISAARRGFTREVIGIAAALIGLIGGIWFYGLAGSFLLPYVSTPQVANFIGFFIVFVGCIILGAVVTMVIRRFVKTVGLSWFDRLLGAVFGLVRGTLMSVAVITALVAFAPTVAADSAPAAVAQSRIAPYVVRGASYLVALAPRELKDGFYSRYSQLKSFWQRNRDKLDAPQKTQDL
jgi:membrane protein required for colicin V production